MEHRSLSEKEPFFAAAAVRFISTSNTWLAILPSLGHQLFGLVFYFSQHLVQGIYQLIYVRRGHNVGREKTQRRAMGAIDQEPQLEHLSMGFLGNSFRVDGKTHHQSQSTHI